VSSASRWRGWAWIGSARRHGSWSAASSAGATILLSAVTIALVILDA
jgi:hypothetical protein